MSERERALLYGIIAGLICYAMAAYGAGWPKVMRLSENGQGCFSPHFIGF